MKLKIEWCDENYMPYVEKITPMINLNDQVVLNPIIPSVAFSGDLLTNAAIDDMVTYTVDKLKTMRLTIIPDEKLGLIDWL